MNWEKLKSLLDSQKLYLTRLDRFKDKLKGITPYQLVELLAAYPTTKPSNSNLSDEQKEEWSQRIKESFRSSQGQLLQNQKTAFVSCWINSDNESAGLWDNYSEGGFAVKCRRLDFENLVRSSIGKSESNHKSFIGRVKYFNYHDVFDKEEEMSRVPSFFMKHVGFRYENEYRLVLIRPDFSHKESLNLSIDCFHPPIFEVIASPYISAEEFDKRQNELRQINSSLQLRESELKIWMNLNKL